MECREAGHGMQVRHSQVGEPKPAGRAPKVDTILLDALARTGLNPYFKYSSVGGLPVREW